MNKSIVMFYLVLLFSCQHDRSANAQDSDQQAVVTRQVELQVSGRVNISDPEIKQVVQLYENYLNSKPDSIYNNPYWNSKEKELYRDFDFSRQSLFNGISSKHLFQIYQPFVLSVEPKGNKYQIRVLYSHNHDDGAYASSKVWCIHKLSAIKEGENWLLENLLVEETKKWKSQKVNFIQYVFPKEYKFNEERATAASAFCESIIDRFNPSYNEAFSFYITNSIDDMGALENFDFYFTGITTGKAREGMILSAKGDEFYPHELVHQILPKNKNRGKIIEEGLATFLGTIEDVDEYTEVIKKLADDVETNDEYSFQWVMQNKAPYNGYQVAYPAGAIICELVFQQKKDVGISQLIRGNSSSYQDLVELVKSILEIDDEKLEYLWLQQLTTYK